MQKQKNKKEGFGKKEWYHVNGADGRGTINDWEEDLEMTQQLDWIKLEDRLPTRDEDVLIYDGETISVGYHDGRVFMDYMNQDDMRVYSNSKVTHWMPLPEPPTT